MAETPSTMAPLGMEALPFRLADPEGKVHLLADFRDTPALLLAFICNHCPFVRHLQSHFAQTAREYQQKGVAVVGINSNDIETYPDDSPEKMKEQAEQVGFTFPYLLDGTQSVARAYRAACTPDFYLFNRNRRLVYRGQYDDSRPGNGKPVTGADLRAALDALLAGRAVSEKQKPSVGCNIKWKLGNEPDYFRR